MHKKLGGTTARDSWPQMVKGIFQPTECPAQYGLSWLGATGHCSGWAGHCSVGAEQLWCASLIIPGFYSSLFLSIIINYYYNILLQFNYKTVLIPTLEVCFPTLLPSRARGRWARGCVGPGCQLGLNHGSVQRESFINRTLKIYIWLKSHPAYLPKQTPSQGIFLNFWTSKSPLASKFEIVRCICKLHFWKLSPG